MRLAVLATLTVAVAVRAHACSCIMPDPKTAFQRSAAVFVGEIVASDRGVATLRVVEWFKGRGVEEMTIAAGESSAAAAMGTAGDGSRHLIYPSGRVMRCRSATGRHPLRARRAISICCGRARAGGGRH